MLYLISYDLLDKSRQNYTDLTEILESWGAKRVLESQWIVRQNNTSPVEIRDRLVDLVGGNDRILITILSPNWSGSNVPFEVRDT